MEKSIVIYGPDTSRVKCNTSAVIVTRHFFHL